MAETSMTALEKAVAHAQAMLIKAEATKHAYLIHWWRSKLAKARAEAEAEIATSRAALAPQPISVPVGQLLDALAVCEGGEILSLDPGDHGQVTLRSIAFNTPVTIVGPGQIGALTISAKTRGIVVDGVSVASFVGTFILWAGIASRPSFVLRNVEARDGGFYLRGVDGFELDGCRAANGSGISLTECRNGHVHHCRITRQNVDAYTIIGACDGITLEENSTADPEITPGAHGDCLQVYGLNGSDPKDLVIRRNEFRGKSLTGGQPAQGILISDSRGAGHQNYLIEENLIDTPAVHGLYVRDVIAGVIVRRNTLLGGGIISLYGQKASAELTVEGNIAQTIYKRGAGDENTVIRDNCTFPKSPDPFPAATGARADFIPLASAGIPDSMGATEWLRSL